MFMGNAGGLFRYRGNCLRKLSYSVMDSHQRELTLDSFKILISES